MKNKVPIHKICVVCKKPYIAYKNNSIYCSPQCKGIRQNKIKKQRKNNPEPNRADREAAIIADNTVSLNHGMSYGKYHLVKYLEGQKKVREANYDNKTIPTSSIQGQ